MNERQYTDLVDGIMQSVEDAIEEAGLDIDCEIMGGVLTLTCENHSKIILSRQLPIFQLWMTAKVGAFHFDYDEAAQQWVCHKGGEPFVEALNRCLSEQAGQDIRLFCNA